MSLDHKISHKCQFFKIEINTSSEKSRINKLSIDVWVVMIGQYLAEIQLQQMKISNLRAQKNLNNL